VTPGSLGRAAGVGTLVALALVAALYAAARLLGDELLVEPPGQPAGGAPLVGALAGTVVGGVLAWIGALIASRTPRPRIVFVALAVVACLASFASPIGAAATTSAAVWLCAMHVAVLIGVVPSLARALPGVSR
jgi:hypothetical protein